MSEAGGSTYWKATDEILARPVAVLTFANGFPRVGEVVTAARAASRLTDPRLTQVFDADDSGERAYVVSEWVTGETLEDLLADGPMEPERAATFLLEAAEALTSAHSAGLAHLCLTPHNLVWTSGGTVKLTGVAVEAVLAGTRSETPALDDVEGLGNMLYAALTGHWPGPEGTLLPPPPSGPDGRPLAPGQMRASIPRKLDAIVCGALRIGTGHPPISTPADLADALAEVPRSPLPFVPLVGSTPPAVVPRPEPPPEATIQVAPPDRPDRTTRPNLPPSGGRSARHATDGPRMNGPLLAMTVALAVVGVAAAGWGLSQMGDGNPSSTAGPKPTPTVTKGFALLTPTGTSVDNNPPHADQAAPLGTRKAIDDSKASYWGTQHYGNAHFGTLRSGVGLVLDMGKSVTVADVRVSMPEAAEAGSVELHVGDSPDHEAPKVATADATGTFTLNGGQARGRYVTLWFTKLPNIGGEYRIKVFNAEVHGIG